MPSSHVLLVDNDDMRRQSLAFNARRRELDQVPGLE
jgi:hypothetical protein